MSFADRAGTMVRTRAALLVALAVLAIFVYVAYETQTWSTRSRLFASTIAVPAVALALVQVVREARALGGPRIVPAEARIAPAALVWTGTFFVSLAMLGLLVTVPLFTVAYLRFAAGERLHYAVAYALVAFLFIVLVFDRLLHIPLPAGAIPLPAITP
jgi:hypothetical protein